MNEKIEIRSGNEEGYTAKQAMKQVVEHMKAKKDHVITVVTLEEKRWDSESILFVKMFLRFLHKNRGRVLLLAENAGKVSRLEEHIAESNTQIQVVETMNLEEHGVSADMILNQINGAEAECIIASLPEEVEADFLEKYRTALDAKVWFSVGTHLEKKAKASKMRNLWTSITERFYRKEK